MYLWAVSSKYIISLFVGEFQHYLTSPINTPFSNVQCLIQNKILILFWFITLLLRENVFQDSSWNICNPFLHSAHSHLDYHLGRRNLNLVLSLILAWSALFKRTAAELSWITVRTWRGMMGKGTKLKDQKQQSIRKLNFRY